ncbi:MAG: hypothetical protein LAT55_08140 [Opitutales bacterium]|nr:hypothetical protein [Opitutales bacterium]
MRRSLLFAAPLFLAASVSVQGLGLDDFQVVTQQTYVTDYIFRGVKETGSAIQTEAEISLNDRHLWGQGDGTVYLGGWANFPVKQDDGDNQIQGYVGYDWSPPQTDKVSFDVGLTVYWHPDGADTADDRTHEGFLGVIFREFGIYGVSAGSYLIHDTDLKTTTALPFVNFRTDLANWGQPQITFEFDAYTGFTSGRKGSESYNYYGVKTAVGYDINEVAGVGVGMGYEDNKGTSRRGNNLFGEASISLGF